MRLTRWIHLGLALAGIFMLAGALTPTPVGAGPNGKGNGKGDDDLGDPAFQPVPAIFEQGYRVSLDCEEPLNDSALAGDGGWSHFANLTGNYTFQIGNLGRKPVAGDRTLSLDLSHAVSATPGGPSLLDFQSVFMAFNRYDCSEAGGSNDFEGCSTDQWRNPDFDDEVRSGLVRMACGDEVNVGITMRGTATNGTDYLLSCNESTSHNQNADPDIEFATAACVHQDADGVCDQWLIRSADRNPATATGTDGPGVSCLIVEDDKRGQVLGVFDMEFRLHVCADGAPCADPASVDPVCSNPTEP